MSSHKIVRVTTIMIMIMISDNDNNNLCNVKNLMYIHRNMNSSYTRKTSLFTLTYPHMVIK